MSLLNSSHQSSMNLVIEKANAAQTARFFHSITLIVASTMIGTLPPNLLMQALEPSSLQMKRTYREEHELDLQKHAPEYVGGWDMSKRLRKMEEFGIYQSAYERIAEWTIDSLLAQL
jgi:hypothetical protein